MEKSQFTQRHVDLIKKWHGKKSDKNNIEQQKDSPELKEAYEIVEDWANAIKDSIFPEGRVKLRKSPVNQGGHFFSYLWAKIYPMQSSPEQLAFTVHISTDEFAVKIDTVNAPKPLVEKYESVRGSYHQSPIVKCLSHEEALGMTFEQLVQWSIGAIESFGLTYDQVCEEIGISAGTKESSDNTQVNSVDAYKPISLNQILYGPPGTGKTYHTIEAAVKAAEPERYQKICATAVDETERRIELRDAYNDLCQQKRIRFVTFHQSYGYEDFVEGLVAETTEDKQVAYRIKDGVFKKICDDAAVSEMHADPAIETNGRVWKLSIEGAHQNATKTYCLENNLGAIGWGDTGDLSKDARNEYFKSQGTNNQNSLMYFCHEMAIGDLVLCIDSKTSVEAVGVVTGEYRYAEEGLPTRDDYCHQLPIKWLAKGFSVDFKSLNDNKQFSLPTCYPLSRLSVGDVLSHLQSHHVQVGETPAASVTAQKQNFVLVIDEINRGNISKIFGELITLIEDSKRGGAEEAVSLTLPYSNKPFSVPDNLYIIGTMNTADRSLAMMDTALRRRFDFVEMMPNPSLLHGAVVKGIHLETLLKTMNERIEILYDREHTLGHAFFMPVKALLDENTEEEEAIAKLVSVFQNKVIPLLQEYFFEDWHKIRLVLGDNQRGERFQFIRETTLDESKLNALFGAEHELNHYGDAPKRYELKPFTDEVWRQPETYIGIYSPKKEQ
ncbi:AAA family ATPase [Vibrio cholerae]|uniref:AAA family ATPase n=1 Tax=Vibrio cholerae TaxID=666 RepID=UPI0035312FA1